MSADNWTICPRCFKKAVEKAKDSYGKVSEEEYNKMRQIVEGFKNGERNTFREDIEIGMDEDGYFGVDYFGECTECGFEFKFNFEKQVMEE